MNSDTRYIAGLLVAAIENDRTQAGELTRDLCHQLGGYIDPITLPPGQAAIYLLALFIQQLED